MAQEKRKRSSFSSHENPSASFLFGHSFSWVRHPLRGWAFGRPPLARSPGPPRSFPPRPRFPSGDSFAPDRGSGMRLRPAPFGRAALAPSFLFLFGSGFGFAFPFGLPRGDRSFLAFLSRFPGIPFCPWIWVGLGWVCLGRGDKMGRAEVLGEIRGVPRGIPGPGGVRLAHNRAHRPSRALGRAGTGLAWPSSLP